MTEKGGGREKLRAALIATAGKDVPDSQLLLEVKGKTQASAMDEIIAAADEE